MPFQQATVAACILANPIIIGAVASYWSLSANALPRALPACAAVTGSTPLIAACSTCPRRWNFKVRVSLWDIGTSDGEVSNSNGNATRGALSFQAAAVGNSALAVRPTEDDKSATKGRPSHVEIIGQAFF